jgi:DNA-binding NtrC family response regulator
MCALRSIPAGHIAASRPRANATTTKHQVDLWKDLRLQSLKVLALTLLRELEALDHPTTNQTSTFNLSSEIRRLEKALIRSALIQTGGRQRRAASLLGMTVATLNRKIKKYGIDQETAATALSELAI